MKHLLRRGLIAQTYILIIIGVTIIGIFTYVTQYQIAKETVRSRTRERASEAVGAVVSSIKEYPAYDWLLSYWAEHAEELDIEYASVCGLPYHPGAAKYFSEKGISVLTK